MPHKPPTEFNLTAPLELLAAEASGDAPKLPRFQMLAYTGGSMRLSGWKFPVVVDLAGLAYPSENLPIRFAHDGKTGVGHADSVRLEQGQLIAEGVVSRDTSEAREIVASSKNGYPWQASIGASVEQYEFVKEGQVASANGQEFPGPVYIVRKSALGEISFVDRGADSNTRARVAAQSQAEVNTMNETGTPVAAAAPEVDPVHAIRDAALLEAQRIAAIHRIFAGTHPNTVVEAIRDQWDENKAMLEKKRLDRPTPPAIAAGASDRFPPEQMLEAALAIPRRVESKYPAELVREAQRQYGRRFKLRDCIAVAARANGYTGPMSLDLDTLNAAMKYAWELPLSIHAAGTSTLSLPNILSNLINKELLSSYSEKQQTWKEIAVVRSVSDFKPVTSHRLLGQLAYEELGPDGEIKHGKLGEQTYTRQVKSYARMFNLDRRTIINDDLGAFDDLRKQLGDGAYQSLNETFWTVFMANSSLFSAGNKNYITGADSVLDDTGAGLQKGITAFRKMETADGKRLDGNPTILLIPPELEAPALRLYQSTNVNTGGASTKDTVGNANIYASKYRPVVSNWLSNTAITGNSTTAWYLLRDPSDEPAIVVSFLDGVDTPTIEATDSDFNKLGIQFRGYLDYGVDQWEPLAGIKSKGAA